MARRAAVSLLAAVGAVAFVTPPFVWWLLSDHDRYVRVISGPPPFDMFGSGPFQLWLAFSFFSLGLGSFVLACTLVVAGRDGEWTAGTRSMATLASGVAALGLLGVLVLLVAP